MTVQVVPKRNIFYGEYWYRTEYNRAAQIITITNITGW